MNHIPKCNKCGARVPSEADFCPECGTRIAQTTPSPKRTLPKKQAKGGATALMSVWKGVILLGAVVIIIALVTQGVEYPVGEMGSLVGFVTRPLSGFGIPSLVIAIGVICAFIGVIISRAGVSGIGGLTSLFGTFYLHTQISALVSELQANPKVSPYGNIVVSGEIFVIIGIILIITGSLGLWQAIRR